MYFYILIFFICMKKTDMQRYTKIYKDIQRYARQRYYTYYINLSPSSVTYSLTESIVMSAISLITFP